MNHLQTAKNHLVEVEKNEATWLVGEAAEVAQAHALIAIAEQLEIMNTDKSEILKKGYKMGQKLATELIQQETK